jgi:hypothetical protein
MSVSVPFRAALAMTLNQVALLLYAVGTAITLAAGALWLMAWRGRPRGWTRHCGSCGFDLTGLPEGATGCPECGRAVGAAVLRPSGRTRDPWQFAAAIAATSLGLSLIWVGQAPQLFRTGRWLCSLLPSETLLTLYPTMPQIASSELVARIRDGSANDPLVLPMLIRAAMDHARANPGNRRGDAWRVLHELQAASFMDTARKAEMLRAALEGLVPHTSSPVCTAGSPFVATAMLPAVQATTWIPPELLELRVQSARIQAGDGSWETLERLTDGAGDTGRLARTVDGMVFRAPAREGAMQGELEILLVQPGPTSEALSRTVSAPFSLQVRPGDTP